MSRVEILPRLQLVHDEDQNGKERNDMWNHRSESVANDRGFKFEIYKDSTRVSFDEVIGFWCDDVDFRTWFISLLAGVPFTAFRWETPSISARTKERDFEFVALDDPGLDRSPDLNAFAEFFDNQNGKNGVVDFANLGRDAIMVVPCPIDLATNYCHLASFLRNAPKSQTHELFQRIGSLMKQRIGEKPVWLSTAGAGVAWLHVRLDDRPKYYGYSPYRTV